MKIGAYQFAVTNNIKKNYEIVKEAICQAKNQNVELLIFPECALTGYPPRDMKNPVMVDYEELSLVYEQIQNISVENGMNIVIGTIIKDEEKYYNSAIVFTTDKQKIIYHKRALWGWDKDNFCKGNQIGIFEMDGCRIGIRICFEVRFPEYFRELYREKSDLNIILFYDVSDYDDVERYELIKSHIRTRAVENVCHTLTVDTILPYQTAPTALYDKSGRILMELERNKEGLLVYDLLNFEMDFGEQGRKQISDMLNFEN